MPKQQASLTSFFGEAAANKTAASPTKKAADDVHPTKKRVLLDDEEEEEEEPSPVSSASSKENKRQRRRVIEDDDDDDEEEEQVQENNNNDDPMMGEDKKEDAAKEKPAEETKEASNKDAVMKESEPKETTTAKEKEKEEEGTKTTNATTTTTVETKKRAASAKKGADSAQKDTASDKKEAASNNKKAKTTSSSFANSFFAPKTGTAGKKKKKTTDAATKDSTKVATPTKKSSNSNSKSEKESDRPEKTSTVALPPPSTLVQAAPKGHFSSDQKVLDGIDEKDWPTNAPVLPYRALCEVFGRIEDTTKRLQIQELLTTLFRQVLLRRYTQTNQSSDQKQHHEDLYHVMYLASNAVAPAYKCVELGIGDAILIKAIGEATGASTNVIKSKYETVGDLGTVAASFKSKQRNLGSFFTNAPKKDAGFSGLTVQMVLQVFREIAETTGNQAQKWKVDKIKKLLVKAAPGTDETKYIIRGLQGKLRIGLAESTVLIALAHALALTEIVAPPPKGDEDEEIPDEAKLFVDKSQTIEKRLEGAVAIIKKAYSEVPSYDALLDAALSVPLERLHEKCSLQPGIPVSPMLAKPTKSVQEVLKRLNGLRFTCEYKYDGERAQVHLLPDGTTKVFSRNLLDTSEKYPEVPHFVKEACKESDPVQSFVMDAEVVAFNQETGKLVPFQVLSTRKKTQEAGQEAKVKIIVQAFDLMYLNGKPLLRHTLSERRALLQKHFQSVDGKFQFAKFLDHEEDGDTTVLEEFLDQAVKGQCEGLMVKTLDVNAIYEPSRRSLNWLKLKKDYLEGLGDSFDLVPLGAYHGKGKRTGFYGAYLLACYDPDSEEFQSVCKIGTGFSDEDLKSLADSLNQHVIPKKAREYNVTDQLECDVWFDAMQVWEVKAADLSKSSAHRGAAGKMDRGIGLRFPRFERVRVDKKPVEATTSDQVLEMYYAQDTVAGGNGADDDNDDGI